MAPFRADEFAPLSEPDGFSTTGRFEPEAARFAEDSRIEPDADIFVDDAPSQAAPMSFGERGREAESADAEPRTFGGFSPDELIAPPAEDEEEDEFMGAADEAAIPRLPEDPFEPQPEPQAVGDLAASPEPHEAEPDEPEPLPTTPLSTREVIEQARAAARAANLSPAEARAGKARASPITAACSAASAASPNRRSVVAAQP